MATSFVSLRRRRRSSKRDGYVLLMTLVLIVVAALSQVGLARRSLQLALESNEAQADLQRRWAAASCRQFFLDRAEEIFIAMEDEDRRPLWPAPSRLHGEFMLGGMPVRLALADEDAKVNLNSVYARKPAELRATMLHLVDGTVAAELRPDLSQEAKLRKRWFSSWGQVFNVPQVLAERRLEPFLTTTAEITCWGGGKPNIRRAPDRTVQVLATAAVGPAAARKLLEARRQSEGDLLLPDLLAMLDLRRADQLKLRGALSDRSSCYSLWLELEDPQRRWYHLWILGDSAATPLTPHLSFSW